MQMIFCFNFRYKVLRQQQSEPAMANYRLLQTAQKRRMYADVGRSSKSASLELERAATESTGGGGAGESADAAEHKKVFRLMVSPAPRDFSEEDGSDGDKENSLLEPPLSPSLTSPRSQGRMCCTDELFLWRFIFLVHSID